MKLTYELHDVSLSTLESVDHRTEFDRILVEIIKVKSALFVINIDKRDQAEYSDLDNCPGTLTDGVRIYS